VPARSIGAGEYSHYSGMNNAHSNRNLAVCLTTLQPNCASHPISCPIVLPDTSRREAKAKTGSEDGPIYTASQDPQVDRREVHFGRRARGAKIEPSEEVREGEGDGKKRR
jgi:hypothetical protein